MSGIDGAPWWAKWISGLAAQGALCWTQWLFHVDKTGTAPMIAGLVAQAVVGVAMVFGPGSAGQLARAVGGALKQARTSLPGGRAPDKPEGP